MTDSPAWRREIRKLHDFFQGWLRGDLERSAFRRLETALAPGFTMVVPSGRLVERAALLEGLRSSRGTKPTLEIRVESPTSRARGEGWRLATYQEWQRSKSGETGRLSTVLFRAADRAPLGVEWVHVHETWIPGAGPG